MGRSRAFSRASDEDSGQGRNKRKRAASNIDNVQFQSGKGLSDGKAALYHCNYCNKDISGKIRIKCAICPDFDLCIECFSVGAEITPHKSNHLYRVMDNLSFPLLRPDWNADEEILLLEGIEMYGFGNWAEVADHVGTKTKTQCIDHYNAIYMNSPCFPLPDLSDVMGKTREELIAMAKEHGEVKKEVLMFSESTMKEGMLFEVKVEDSRKEDSICQPSCSFTSDVRFGMGSSTGNAFSGKIKKKASNMAHVKDRIKVEELQSERSVGEKKPKISGDDEGPSVTELAGYNAKRHEFEIEYDNDAEQLLADMEFKNTDTRAEHDLKLQVLHIYSKRLDERKRRKDFILERNLLYQNLYEKHLPPEEKEICSRLKVFMRFQSKEEHEELLRSAIEEHRIARRIQELQDARAAGYRTAAEAYKYIEEKRKKEDEESAKKTNENSQAIAGDKVQESPRGVPRASTAGDRELSLPSSATFIPGSLDSWDVNGLHGADLLSETEKELCREIRILPSHYLSMLQAMSSEIYKGNVTKKSDVYGLFKVEPSKVDRVYEMLVKKGIALG